MKRAFDCSAALLGLLVLAPLFAVVAALIKADSDGPVFFRQERVGRGFRPFRIYKFRTMVKDASRKGGLITSGDDPRITRVGRFLRKAKIDELPQLINVIKGDMSVVGPRPEVQTYVDALRREFDEILRVRPGITDVASLHFHDEAAILGRFHNPEQVYMTAVLPAKLSLSKEYIRHSSFTSDVRVILQTVATMFRGGQSSTARPPVSLV